MFDGLRYVMLDDPDRHSKLLLMYPVPLKGNPWGVLAPVRGTPWATEVPVVTGEALSHALHGYVRPLLLQLGPPPMARALRLPNGEAACRDRGGCSAATLNCVPSSYLMPACYVPGKVDAPVRAHVAVIARAWAEGRYVCIVDGPEHVVR